MGAKGIISDAEFLRLWSKLRSPAKLAKLLNVSDRCIYARRRRIEERSGEALISADRRNKELEKFNYRTVIRKVSGPVILFGDMHCWNVEEDSTPAFHALVYLIKKLKPKLIVNMGDTFDGSTVSRWPRSYEDMPSVREELECAKILLGKIEDAAPEDSNLVFTAGNHDSRFCTKLANAVPEFKGVKGFDLKDHLEAWKFTWSLVINPGTPGETWCKHRYHQGVHAAYQNALKVGSVHFCQGHTHALEAKPITDLKVGRRWSVMTGTLSNTGPINKWSYGEDNPTNACSGFIVLHYTSDYRLLPPELVEQIGSEVYWRGEKIIWKK